MRLIYLTDDFFDRYADCKEILQKRDRPYACLKIEIDGHTFAIPFRHHIAHKYAYFTIGEAGLDYSKAVIIEDERYIAAGEAVIDSAEMKTIKGRESVIANGMRRYYKVYLNAAAHKDNPHYGNILRWSALQYFIRP